MRPAARMPKLTRRSRVLIAIALAVVALLLFGPRLIDAYVSWLWFGELGFRSVFTTQLLTRIVVFLVVALVVGAIVFAGLALAYRNRHPRPLGGVGLTGRPGLLGAHPAVPAWRQFRGHRPAVRQGPGFLRVRPAVLQA